MFRSIRAIALVAVLATVVVAAPTAQAGDKQLKVKGGKTALKISPGAAGALDSLGVAASPIGSADACGARFKFPITGGKLNAETLAGQIRHSGGIRLSAGSKHLDLRRFTHQHRLEAEPDREGGRRASLDPAARPERGGGPQGRAPGRREERRGSADGHSRDGAQRHVQRQRLHPRSQTRRGEG